MNKISETDIHDEIAAELLEAEQEAELTDLRLSAQDVLKSIAVKLEETMQDKPMYDPETGLPTDPAYLECGLPEFLQTSLDRMKATWERLDAGIKDIRWDCDYCELQSDINVAEVCGLISEEQAWYLRENYLRIERPGEIP